jgi:hypothetical protein
MLGGSIILLARKNCQKKITQTKIKVAYVKNYSGWKDK